MNIVKKKTKAGKQKKNPKNLLQKTDPEESNQKELEEHQSLISSLLHKGEACYQKLILWQQTNKILLRLALAEEKRNELMQEDIEEESEEEEEEDTDDEEEEEESEDEPEE